MRIADISESNVDPLARAVRHRLRRQLGVEAGIPVLLSTEKPRCRLVPIAEVGENPLDYQVIRHNPPPSPPLRCRAATCSLPNLAKATGNTRWIFPLRPHDVLLCTCAFTCFASCMRWQTAHEPPDFYTR